MSNLPGWKMIGVVWLASVTVVCQVRADEAGEARDREIRELAAFVRNKGYYALRDPKEKVAIARLQELREYAAPVIAEMLTAGLKSRQEKGPWMEVYRPLYILEGMGEHAKVALTDVIQALDDKHLANVGAAARVLGSIGPAAKDALPKLEETWKSPDKQDATKRIAASAIKKIDPQRAEMLGIK